MSVTEYPAAVESVTLFPDVGTVPANVTVPATGATTELPGAPPMSMPRC